MRECGNNDPGILAFAGSTRSASFNKRLIVVAAGLARDAGAEVTLIDLRDFPLPLYDGDDEARTGVPAAALELRSLIAASQGLLVSTPEYNGSVSAVLKNVLDWCSRPTDGQNGLAAFRGKPVALLASSMSPFGGIRAVAHLRGIMSKMGANVLADEVLVPTAQNAFKEDGSLVNEATRTLVAQLTKNLVVHARRLATS